MRRIRNFRIVTFLPVGPEYISAPELVRRIGLRVPLRYGNYSDVAFYTEGIELFKPEAGSNPTLGEIDEITAEKSVRIEFSIPLEEKLLQDCISTLEENHPWEVPVINVYEISDFVAAPSR